MAYMTVYRYQFALEDRASVFLPKGAEILMVGMKKGEEYVSLWARVDSFAEKHEVRLAIRGTGHPLDGTEGEHVGSFICSDDYCVFHVFREKDER